MDNTAYYKNLIVYQKAKGLTVDVLSCQYEYKNRQFDFIVNQLFRAVSSICANIVEGYGRHYKQDYRHFISIARGSSFETDYWLEIVLQLQIFEKKKVLDFINRNQELIKILTTLMKKLERSPQT